MSESKADAILHNEAQAREILARRNACVLAGCDVDGNPAHGGRWALRNTATAAASSSLNPEPCATTLRD